MSRCRKRTGRFSHDEHTYGPNDACVKLDIHLYVEVEADGGATRQAMAVV